MKIGIPKEIVQRECRMAATPETVTKMIKAGMEVYIQSGAGEKAYISDGQYQDAGAFIEIGEEALFGKANIILKVRSPDLQEIDQMQDNSLLIASFSIANSIPLLEKLNKKSITAFSLDFLPRIARAQAMDILSSMNSLAGYKSIILAASYLGKIFPMMTTAAGTIQPAKVMVIGAGVAGLQAIATARRLGAVVLAFDTRPVVAEQVKSLGADFVSLETTHDAAEDAGGYAKEQSIEFYRKEQEIIQQYLKTADVIVTTALIPNKKAPILITGSMVKEMMPGSVIVDLAASQGGNCEMTEPEKIIAKHHITIIGLDLVSSMPIHASQLFSKNIFSFLNYIAPQIDAKQFDLSDEIIANCMMTHQGQTVHPILKQKG